MTTLVNSSNLCQVRAPAPADAGGARAAAPGLGAGGGGGAELRFSGVVLGKGWELSSGNPSS